MPHSAAMKKSSAFFPVSLEISKDKYDEWRYHYPEFDTTQTWAKVPPQALSDALVEMFQDKLKPDK